MTRRRDSVRRSRGGARTRSRDHGTCRDRWRGLPRYLPLCLVVALAGCFGETTQPQDTTGPNAISDLAAVQVDSTVVLRWTAPGDDRGSGQAARYELRTLTSPMSEQDWESGAIYPEVPAPAAAGTRQEMTVSGLPQGQLRYFALKSADEVPNWSFMSNQVSAVPGVPACGLTPDTLAFGRVAVGASFEMRLVIRNDGGGTLRGQVESPCTDFPVVSGASVFELLHGQTPQSPVEVRFAPAAPGERTCTLSLGPDCPPVICTGTGASIDPGLVLLDSGTFLMGSPAEEPGREADEERHQVTLTHGFYVSDHEVTQAEWQALMQWNESIFPGADRPVDTITWFDALEFCNRLSERDGLTPAYGIDVRNEVREGNHIVQANVNWDDLADGYRLLTEAEWEYACRAGTQTALYNGDLDPLRLECLPPDPNLDRAAWYCGNSRAASRPIEAKDANPRGLHDMLGNVYEWCWDWYDPDYGQTRAHPGDPLGPQTDPSGPDLGGGRVARGGSWFSNAEQCRCAYRFYHSPAGFYDDVGLRIARNGP